MLSSSPLKIPKKRKQVVLQVHPDGKVVGSLFLSHQSKHAWREEEPLDVLNQPSPFVVLQREDPDELRFYNKTSIVRVEYQEDSTPDLEDMTPLYCRLHMMDGSLVDGCIRHALRPDHARLSDYLNLNDERFAKIHTKDGDLWLVHKAYIVYVTPLDEQMKPSIVHISDDV